MMMWLTKASFEQTFSRAGAVRPETVATEIAELLEGERPQELHVDGATVRVSGPFAVFWVRWGSVMGIRLADFEVSGDDDGVIVATSVRTRFPLEVAALAAVLVAIAVGVQVHQGLLDWGDPLILPTAVLYLSFPGLSAVFARWQLSLNVRSLVRNAVSRAEQAKGPGEDV